MDKLTWVATTNMFVRDGNKVLVIKRPDNITEFPGWYILPGGKQEPNETPIQGAIRETFEETGIHAINPTLRIIATHLHDYKAKVYIVYIFEAEKFDGELKSSTEGQAQWIDLNDLINNEKLFPDLKRHINLCLQNPGKELFFTYHQFDQNLKILEER